MYVYISNMDEPYRQQLAAQNVTVYKHFKSVRMRRSNRLKLKQFYFRTSITMVTCCRLYTKFN